MNTDYIGKPVSRVDGLAKVTGAAKYAAEYNVQDLAYGSVVSSTIARGKILKIDPSEALRLPGVLRVFTHENSPRKGRKDSDYKDEAAPAGSPFRPLYDDEVRYNSQPVALVVAESPELAVYASTLIRVSYSQGKHATSLYNEREKAYDPKLREFIVVNNYRGNAAQALGGAAVKIEADYHTPGEHPNPMETFATTAVPNGNGKLTVYDKTQGVQNVYRYLCNIFGYSGDDLTVISPFVGGGFGTGLRPQYQVFLAVLAARELKRPVRVSLTRQQMYSFTRRPETWQRISIGATRDGMLQSIIHEAIAETSKYEDHTETVTNWSGLLYKCDNVKLHQKVVSLDVSTPGDMRAPGAVWGLYALECAMDELAYKTGVDQVDLRLKNYAEKDQFSGKPFSSNELRECYRQASERFGWAKRSPEPRSMRDGRMMVGWGMAGGMWEAFHVPASAKALLKADGRLTISSATSDIGTGTYTIMAQIAAETLGLPIENVTSMLGNSTLPQSWVEGGSFTALSTGTAVQTACENIRKRLFQSALLLDDSPFTGLTIDDMIFAGGNMLSRSDNSRSVPIVDVMRQSGIEFIEEDASAGPSPEEGQYSNWVHSAVFAEVRIDQDLFTIRVPRVVSALAAGRILNMKTARSQVIGGIVMGIGSAIEEESLIDHTFGRFMNHNLADYHVPVNADINDIDVIFVEEHDRANPLGCKGLGEIGTVGVAAAIANAVFHATGQRIRELPVTLDKLLVKMQ